MVLKIAHSKPCITWPSAFSIAFEYYHMWLKYVKKSDEWQRQIITNKQITNKCRAILSIFIAIDHTEFVLANE